MKELQLFSFNINSENIDDISLKVFKLPRGVKEVIQSLNDGVKNGVTYKSIFKVASALFDKIIYSNNSLYKIEKNNDIWFYAIEEFDLEIFKIKVTEWLREEYKARKGEELKLIFNEKWGFDGAVTLSEILEDDKSPKYNIIPQYYIYKLSKENYKFESIEKELKFFRVIGEKNATMITLPIDIENKRYTPFSYYVTVVMKKPIDTLNCVLNCSLHIRAWSEKEVIKDNRFIYEYKDGLNMCIYRENPYYYNEDILFNKVAVKSYREGVLAFKDKADEIYVKLAGIQVDDILNSPKEFINNREDIIGLIINKDKKNVKTQSGAGLPERHEMISLIKEKLNSLELRKPILEMKQRLIGKMDDVKKSKENSVGDEIALTLTKVNKEPYMPNKGYKKFNIILATDEEELLLKAKKLFVERLGLIEQGESIYINNSGIEFKIKRISNDFTRALNEGENKINRLKELEDILECESNETLQLALIDILNYHEERGLEEKDPKNLIRVAFKNKGIITQFINYKKQKEEAAIDNKIYNAIKDLLSSAGFMEARLRGIKGLNSDDILVGICKISGGENENILCMSKIVNERIYLNMYGINKWMSMEEYIFNINSKYMDKFCIKKVDKRISDSAHQWICDELSNILQYEKRVIAFIDVDLRSSFWKFVGNEKFINMDALRIPNKNKLVLVRINDNGDGEVPEYSIFDGKTDLNKKSGIFKGENSTFYLVGKRIDTDQIPVGVTKCSSPNKPLRKPSLYEVNIQGDLSEKEKDNIAIITQNLRVMNISYDSHASLPLPLYCTRRLTEYIRAEKSCK